MDKKQNAEMMRALKVLDSMDNIGQNYYLIASYLFYHIKQYGKNICIVAPSGFGKTPITDLLLKKICKDVSVRHFQSFNKLGLERAKNEVDIILCELTPSIYENNKEFFPRIDWHILQFNM